ncbi:MAG: MnmC family methyltransferase [Candidatus Woesearchaeota archaeon]|jgi:tRNA U34 5-methylaminomethyl-2-thiouridine-forming methyltransferase MnmC
MTFKKEITQDGTYTFVHPETNDFYKTMSGALSECIEKHSKGMEIDKCEKDEIVILDVCAGAGYNSLAGIGVIRQAHPNKKIKIYYLENDTRILEMANLIDFDSVTNDITIDTSYYKLIQHFIKEFMDNGKTIHTEQDITLIMLYGDAKEEILKVPDGICDFCFFDPFSPMKVLDMWSIDFFKKVYSKMTKSGKLTTYSYAKWVRQNFRDAGFLVTDGPIFRRRSPSTIAIKE